jgi:GABA(A) receptor-associated protein
MPIFTDYEKLKSKYTDRTPVLVEGLAGREIKRKYLVPLEFTIAEFVSMLRDKIYIKSNESVYVTINGVIPRASEYISRYEHNSPVIVVVHIEDTFGCCVL